MKLALLTNQVREARRPPLFVLPVDAVMLARLFPAAKKTASKTSRAGKLPPAPASSVRQPSSRNPSPVQIPMEVFRSPDRSAPPGQTIRNGRRDSNPMNSNPLPPVQPFLKPAPILVSRNNLVRPAGTPKKSAEAASYPPSIPIPRRAPPGVQGLPEHQEPTHQQAELLQPSKAASNPMSPAASSSPVSSNETRSALNLHQLMEQHPDLPRQSIILGACNDGWPLMLNLFDPSVGALLTISDERESQLDLLRNAIESAAARNSPRSLQFLVISHQPQGWVSWVNEHGFTRHCLGIAGAEEESVTVWVLRMADWTEQRRLGKTSGPPILLVMDTLSFRSRLTDDVRQNLDWTVREGPPAQIWPLGTISTELATSMGARTLQLFPSHILGRSKDPQAYAQLLGLNEQDAGSFSEPHHFAVRVGQRLIHFQLPG